MKNKINKISERPFNDRKMLDDWCSLARKSRGSLLKAAVILQKAYNCNI